MEPEYEPEPEAKKAIDYAKANGVTAGIVMMVVGFQTDEDAICLRNLLWYAYKSGVMVRFVPKEDQ